MMELEDEAEVAVAELGQRLRVSFVIAQRAVESAQGDPASQRWIALAARCAVERCFEGVGRLAFNSVLARDYPVVLATTALSGLLVIVGSLLADLLQMALDPRVRDAV